MPVWFVFVLLIKKKKKRSRQRERPPCFPSYRGTCLMAAPTFNGRTVYANLLSVAVLLHFIPLHLQLPASLEIMSDPGEGEDEVQFLRTVSNDKLT